MDNKSKSLNMIISEYQKIEFQIIENDGEISENLDDLINRNTKDLENKFNNYEKFIRYLSSQSDHLKEMESHYVKRRKVIDKSIDKLRTNLVGAIKSADKKSIKTSEFNFTLCKSEKWIINKDGINDNTKSELIKNGLAEELFKPFLSKIKAEYKAKEKKPSWIDIDSSEYIKVT